VGVRRIAEDDVFTVSVGLPQLKACYTSETRELLSIVINSTSAAEANLALEALKDSIPEYVLVTACNLREVLQAFPPSPFVMSTDCESLARIAELERDVAVLRKVAPDGTEICLTTAGNLVLDFIVKTREGRQLYWTPIPVVDDFVNPAVVDAILDSDCLLVEAIELLKHMGVVFNPKFYLSLEDFRLEYASAAIGALDELF
jgi:hypothetical protein